MRSIAWIFVALVIGPASLPFAACTSFTPAAEPSDAAGAGPDVDPQDASSGADAPVNTACRTKPFTVKEYVPIVGTLNGDTRAYRRVPGGSTWVVGQASANNIFEVDNVNATQLFASLPANHPSMALGGRIFFETNQATPIAIQSATRSSPTAPFGTPVEIVLTDSSNEEPFALPDGKAFYYSRNQIIAKATFVGAGPPEQWSTLDLPELGAGARHPVPTEDELVIYFSSTRAPSVSSDVWMATRASRGVPFGTPSRVTELSSAAEDRPTDVTADGCTLWFTTTRDDGLFRVYRAVRE